MFNNFLVVCSLQLTAETEKKHKKYLFDSDWTNPSIQIGKTTVN